VPIVLSSYDGKRERAGFRSLASCGLLWLCPVCSSTIRQERAAEVKATLTWHRAKHENATDLARLLTLTVAHNWGADLATLRGGVADAWRRMVRGAPWERFSARVGLIGFVRALEATHGQHGWHPHLHILLFVANAALIDEDREWLSERWRACVVREIGPAAEPSTEHGCALTGCDEDGAYLQKLGLEVVGTGDKRAASGNRSPWEILADLDVAHPSESDGALWLEWVHGMRGARQLTWSRGLKACAGIEERTEAQCLEAEERGPGRIVCELSAEEWDAIRDIPDLPARVLAAAETGGAPAVFQVVGLATRGRGPPDRAR
jgi:hypothetical protein